MAENRTDICGPVGLPAAPPERRSSARVPLNRPVRIGPPGGLPSSAVAARDLSAGGLFIEADRKVRVGARFSVEVPLAEGEVYVEEAEVVDNRPDGFGVRFLIVSSEGTRSLEEEVADRAPVTLRSIPDEDFLDSRLPEMPSFPPATLEATTLEIGGGLDEEEPSVLAPKLERGASTLQVRMRTRWSKMKAWLRSVPIVSGILYLSGAGMLLVVGIAVLLEPRDEEQLVMPEGRRTVPNDIHERLVENTGPVGLREPARVAPSLRVVNPLPEKEASVFTPVSEAPSTPRPAAEPKPPRPPRKAAKKKTKPQAKGTAAATVQVSVGSGVSVKKQFVMHEPERFVVDVRGVKGEPEMPRGSGMVRAVRFGRHDDFSRIVVDANKAIASAHAAVMGDRLKVSLRFAEK